MASKLDLTVSRIPDGVYMAVLDKADGTRVTRESIAFSASKATVNFASVNVGETIKGYIDDGQNIVTRAAYIEATTTPGAAVNTYVLSLSGTDKIELPSEITIPQGQALSVYVRIKDTTAPRVLFSGATTPRCYAFISGTTISCPEADVIKVNGFLSDQFPDDDNMHKITITFKQAVKLSVFGLSHAGIFGLNGQIRAIELHTGEKFTVDDNAATITGTSGTVMPLTGGTWEQWSSQDV